MKIGRCFARNPFLPQSLCMAKAVLIIDDDRVGQRIVKMTLVKQLQLNCVTADNGREGLQILARRTDVGLVVLDLGMPVMNGHEVLDVLQNEYAHIPAIVLTGSRDMQDAVRAMKNGAFDFLAKPLNQNALIIAARNALNLSVLAVGGLANEVNDRFGFSYLLGHDGGLAQCVDLGRKAAGSQLPVLIQGETGTGKEMFARAIHGESARKGKSFVAVNCGAIPEKLIESTLFGHEKGAFTGAINKALGKFREADGGTLFLDEIGELPLDAQVKMLRAIQQQEIEPVGAAKSEKVDVRIISATNRVLEHEVQQNRFREDLYFRLNVLQIGLPPLRVRREDIGDLVQHFLVLAARDSRVKKRRLTDGALKRLYDHEWAGNVRELENVIYRAVALSEGTDIGVDDIVFSQHGLREKSWQSVQHVEIVNEDGALRALKDIEAEVLQKALAFCDQNMTRTAKALGIAKSTLYAKI